MPKGVYPCFKCGMWFESVEARRGHTCKKVEKEKVVPVDQEKEVVSSEEKSMEDTDFNRSEVIQKLKDTGVINDKRSVSRKSNEELMLMLEQS